MPAHPCTPGVFTNLHLIHLYRSGDTAYVDAAADCGSTAVVTARLTVPAHDMIGAPFTTPAGGTHVFRLALPFPPAWPRGQGRVLYLQGMRAAGTGPATLRLIAAWQR